MHHTLKPDSNPISAPPFPPSARAAVPHVRPAELRQDHGQPGPVPAALQPGAAVGGDRGVSVRAAQQEGPAPQEVHQDRSAVSGTMSAHGGGGVSFSRL